MEIMKTHTTLGRDAILAAETLLDSPNSFLQCAREIAYSHQEKWDGSGYPEGLKGEAIPLSARLMAAALAQSGCKAEYVDALAVIKTDGAFGRASPDLRQ